MLKLIKKYFPELSIGLIFILYAFGFNFYRVVGDGTLYYAFLEKMLRIPSPESSLQTLNSTYFFQCGCAYFNAPFYLIAYFFENLFKVHWNFNGITLRQVSINIAANFYMLLSLMLTVKILKKMGFRSIIFPVLSILFSTSAISTAVIMPSGNNNIDLFVSTVFIYLFLSARQKNNVSTFLMGAWLVIAILVRYLNFIIFIPVAIYYILKRQYRNLILFSGGFLFLAWIIPLILFTYNGTISPFYNTSINSDATLRGVVSLFPTYILKYLVHPLHGLFIWSPVIVFSLIGFFSLEKTKEKIGYLLFSIFFSQLFMYGYLNEWYAGWSFSNRYLGNFFTIYTIGLASFIDKYGLRAKVIAILFTFYSLVLYLNWQLCVMNGEFGTPLDMINCWVKGRSRSFMDYHVNAQSFTHRLFEFCRYKYIFKH